MGRQEPPPGPPNRAPPPAGRECLTEVQALAFAAGEGPLSRAREVTGHVDGCAVCQALVAEAARALDQIPPVSSERGLLRTLRVGELVRGRYEILRFVGAGGMGEVYEARDGDLGTTLALKTLALPVLDDRQAVQRLKGEVLIARRATHANVCRIFDFGVHQRAGADGSVEEIPFLTMELLEGRTLAERLRAGKMTPAEVRPIAAQMLVGLGAVHRAGIVHRDLKPENVFLMTEPGQTAPRVVLMDFGLARAASTGAGLSASLGVVGTLGYMAPEQLAGGPATPASDLYAFGVVLFEMLTGRRPFSGDVSPAATLQGVAALQPHWRPAILRCFERELAERFTSVEQVRSALFGAVPGPRPRWSRRRSAALAAAAVVLAALVVLGRGAIRGPGGAPAAAPPVLVQGSAAPPAAPPVAAVSPPPVAPVAVAPVRTVPPLPPAEVRHRGVRAQRARELPPAREPDVPPPAAPALPPAAPAPAPVIAPPAPAPAPVPVKPAAPRRVEKW